MAKQKYHVTKTDKGWQLKKEGASRASLTGKTQNDVVNEVLLTFTCYFGGNRYSN